MAGCGETPPTPEDSAAFDRSAYEDAIADDELAVSARLASPTNDGDGDVRVEVDRRPSDFTTRLAVSIARESGQVAFEVVEVGERIYFREGPADAAWRVDLDRSQRRRRRHAACRVTGSGISGCRRYCRLSSRRRVDRARRRAVSFQPEACFVLTNPDLEFASLYVDADTYRPVHIRLARPGMRAAGEIEIDWMAAAPVESPANARPVDAGKFAAALGPVLQAMGL